VNEGVRWISAVPRVTQHGQDAADCDRYVRREDPDQHAGRWRPLQGSIQFGELSTQDRQGPQPCPV